MLVIREMIKTTRSLRLRKKLLTLVAALKVPFTPQI